MLKNRFIILGLMICLILAAVPSVLSATDKTPVEAPVISQTTAPTTAVTVSDSQAVGAAAVTSKVATKYWLELKVYPSSNTRALWLYAGNSWKYLPNPTENIENSVQQAFTNPTKFQVQVWYSGDKIVGLVVNSK